MVDSFNPQSSSRLTKNEKLGFVGLIVLAILVIYLGFKQMGNNINGPFLARLAASLSKNSFEEQKELSEAEQTAILKTKDTDKDGLSDFDELNVYQTSPYIADTDSDGMSDKTEIDKGADPNCPIGKDCKTELANPAAGIAVTTTLSLPLSTGPSADQLLLQSIFGNNPDPKFLREFLLKQGIDKKTLDSFKDEELLRVFKEIISATSTLTAPLSTASSNLNSMSAADLRALLKQQGVSEEALKKISDKDLLDLVKELK